MSLIILIVVAALLWAVLAVPLAMIVGRLSRGNETEVADTTPTPPAHTRHLVEH